MNHDATLSLAARLIQTQQFSQAESLLITTLQAQPQSAAAWQLLAQLAVQTGKYSQGLFAAWQANNQQNAPAMQSLFAQCLSRVALTEHDPQLQQAVARAVTETWGSPAALAEQAGKLLKLDPLLRPHLAHPPDASRTTPPPLDERTLVALDQHVLLNPLLQSAPVCDLALEGLFTRLRAQLLHRPADDCLNLTASLAQQCFINEYLWPVSAAEQATVAGLHQQTAQNPQATAGQILRLACYIPLHRIAGADDWLTDRTWPQPVPAVLIQQIAEPPAEAQLAAALPCLTPIDDAVSQAVQAMYEESPYPRWVRTPPPPIAQPLNTFLSAQYPLSGYRPLASDQPLQVLIAGGGTGQHPIHTAQRFAHAQVQVIDLSRASLAYAQRKAQALGLPQLHFAQADILQLEQTRPFTHCFDLIESVGVLHHMADPWAGWSALLSQLRPGGLMKLGFYSRAARADINRLRDIIAAEGYGNSPAAIRACRQHLIAHSQAAHLDSIFRLRDFYSISACRDLLFHVQEHQMTLPDIAAFMTAKGLRFIGFEIGADTLARYHTEFPDDPAATALDHWATFEQRYPDTFISMYQFWVQHAA